jgi:hypothetical protein
MKNFIPPLSIYFVWHPADDQFVKPLYDYCFALLSRDINQPFSRAMSLPFFYRTCAKKGIPNPVKVVSNKTIIYVFVSTEVAADEEWNDYLDSIPKGENVITIPVAIDSLALSLNDIFGGINFVRAYEFDTKFIKEQIFISISHEIYRFSLNESFKELGKDNALKLFLSHAKDGKHGVKLAKALKEYIDNSSMRNFFDATDISPGYKFDEEISGHIIESTLIAIHTDSYSSRYWCQREILCAKENNRPIIAVDSLEEFEDRRFPFATNVPGIHIQLGSDSPFTIDLLRILCAALLETIRYFYSKMLLETYKQAGWIDEAAFILARPPEVSDFDKLIVNNGTSIEMMFKKVIYPEPPVYLEELSFLSKLGIQTSTPISIDLGSLKGKHIGMSISDQSLEDFIEKGISNKHLVQLSQDIARHLLAREGVLHYGGDLREDGFTEFLFNEASALKSRTLSTEININNYISWPIYLNDDMQIKNWRGKYRSVAKMINVPPPDDIKELIPNSEDLLQPINTQNLFVWSRSLTEMRETMMSNCNVRICAGGRQRGYKGFMPGVLEEILLAIENGLPLYLLGGFGGITGSVCEVIQGDEVPKELTEVWQIENNAGYRELLDFSKSRGRSINYDSIVETLKNANFNNGLSEEENKRLFNTIIIDEAMYLLFKGLGNLFSSSR